MYVAINGVNNNKSVYIMQSYRKADGKTSSRVHRKLGRLDDLLEQFSGDKEKMMIWAKKEAEKDTAAYNAKTENVSISFSKSSYISKNEERSFNVGYLFLQFLLLDSFVFVEVVQGSLQGTDFCCQSIGGRTGFYFVFASMFDVFLQEFFFAFRIAIAKE